MFFRTWLALFLYPSHCYTVLVFLIFRYLKHKKWTHSWNSHKDLLIHTMSGKWILRNDRLQSTLLTAIAIYKQWQKKLSNHNPPKPDNSRKKISLNVSDCENWYLEKDNYIQKKTQGGFIDISKPVVLISGHKFYFIILLPANVPVVNSLYSFVIAKFGVLPNIQSTLLLERTKNRTRALFRGWTFEDIYST